LNSRRFSGVLSSLFTWDHCAGLTPSSFAAIARSFALFLHGCYERVDKIPATIAPVKTSAKPPFGCDGTRYSTALYACKAPLRRASETAEVLPSNSYRRSVVDLDGPNISPRICFGGSARAGCLARWQPRR
jgi:hypothetical protein